MTGEEMAHCDVPDKLAMFSYLTQIYEAFRGEIPHIKHPKLVSYIDERVMTVISVFFPAPIFFSFIFVVHHLIQKARHPPRKSCPRCCHCSHRSNKIPELNNNRVERNRVTRYKSFFESKTRLDQGRPRQRQLSRAMPLVISPIDSRTVISQSAIVHAFRLVIRRNPRTTRGLFTPSNCRN